MPLRELRVTVLCSSEFQAVDVVSVTAKLNSQRFAEKRYPKIADLL
jgi:hypothetical protein